MSGEIATIGYAIKENGVLLMSTASNSMRGAQARYLIRMRVLTHTEASVLSDRDITDIWRERRVMTAEIAGVKLVEFEREEKC